MVVRLRLEQRYGRNYCTLCITGLFGCRWHRYKQSNAPTSKYDVIWLLFLVSCACCSLFCFYSLFIGKNDRISIDRLLYEYSGVWFSWFLLLYVLSAIATAYSCILLTLAIYHAAANKEIYLHWIHKILLLLLCSLTLAYVIIAALVYPRFSSLLLISLQSSAPWLYLSAVLLLSLLSWVVAVKIQRIYSLVVRVLCGFLYFLIILGVIATQFIVLNDSPLVGKHVTFSSKPSIYGLGGCPKYAADSTRLAVQHAVDLGIAGISLDVHRSADNKSFAMTPLAYDVLKSTLIQRYGNSDVKELNMSQITDVHYGSLYLKKDPLYATRRLSNDQHRNIESQRITNLSYTTAPLLQTNISLLLRSPQNDFDLLKRVVMQLNATGIKLSQMYIAQEICAGPFLTVTRNEKVRCVETGSSGMLNSWQLRDYAHIGWTGTRQSATVRGAGDSEGANLFVYPVESSWFFSLLWSARFSAVLTRECRLLHSMSAPDWHMTRTEFLLFWVLSAVACVLLSAVAFIVVRYQQCPQHKYMMDLEVTSSGSASMTSLRERVTSKMTSQQERKQQKRDMKQQLIELDAASLHSVNENQAVEGDTVVIEADVELSSEQQTHNSLHRTQS